MGLIPGPIASLSGRSSIQAPFGLGRWDRVRSTLRAIQAPFRLGRWDRVRSTLRAIQAPFGLGRWDRVRSTLHEEGGPLAPLKTTALRLVNLRSRGFRRFFFRNRVRSNQTQFLAFGLIVRIFEKFQHELRSICEPIANSSR